MKRREFILGTSCTVTLGAGCLGSGSEDTTDITVSNESDQTLTATIRVQSESSDEQLLNESFDIGPGNTKEYDEIVSDLEVEVKLNIENGPEKTYGWYDDEHDSEFLLINITSDSISFEEGIE